MNESFQLRTTMSPKPLRVKLHVKKPTVLALKKNIRRSSCYDKPPAAVADIFNRNDNNKIQELNTSKRDLEFETIQSNVDESCAMFADLSIIAKDTSMKAMNSTFLEGRHTQFHELFQAGQKKNERPNRIPVQQNIEDERGDVPKVLDIHGSSWRNRDIEVLRTEPKKKLTSRINEVHKAVCQTEIKSNRRKQGDQNNLVSRNGKQLFVQEPSLNNSSTNRNKFRRLYYGEHEFDADTELTSKKNFKRIVNPQIVKEGSLKIISNVKKGAQNIQEKGTTLIKSCGSERSINNKPKDLNGNNGKSFDTVVSESEDTTDSEDELISKRNFKRIIQPHFLHERSFKKIADIQKDVHNIKDKDINLKHSTCSESISTSKSKLNDSNVELKLTKVVLTPNSEDGLLMKRNFERIVHPKAVNEKYCNDEGSAIKIGHSIYSEHTSQNKNKELCNSSDKLRSNEDSEILVISDSDDDITRANIFKRIQKSTQKSRPLVERFDNTLKKSESTKNEPINVRNYQNNDQENVIDDLDDVRKVLDDIYGSSWRERETEILRTEPKNRVFAKTDNVCKAISKTDVKRIQTNPHIIPIKMNFPLLNAGVTTKNTYTESPEPTFLVTRKHIDRRKLFPSVDSEEEDFSRRPELTTSSKNVASKTRTIDTKTLATPLLKCHTNKTSAKSIPKGSWVKDICDSGSETDESVAGGGCSNDSDWETPQDEYFPKYFKTTGVKSTAQTKQKTFLESLSKNVPIFQAHPTARIFRNDFKTHRDELTTRLFKLFNEEVFDGLLAPDTNIDWNTRLRGTAGYCRVKKITNRDKIVNRIVAVSLSSKVLDSPDRLRDTLIHEMCHAVNWITDGERGHGPSWRKWTIKARTVFPELPPISTCHTYNIATKYTYRCTECGYSFGRHSKSISIEKKCCGYCHGKLELLLNKVSKSGSTNSATPVPATPTRKPSGFALFVQDRYKICKTPDLKHGDVMRLLSKQFASLKVERKIASDN